MPSAEPVCAGSGIGRYAPRTRAPGHNGQGDEKILDATDDGRHGGASEEASSNGGVLGFWAVGACSPPGSAHTQCGGAGEGELFPIG